MSRRRRSYATRNMILKFCQRLFKPVSPGGGVSQQFKFRVHISEIKRTFKTQTVMASATGLIDFIHASPTPFHMVETAGAMLSSAGFTQLREKESWSSSVAPGGRFFYSRNRSTIVAFTVGARYQPGGAFKVIGAHSDSPVLKLKPVTKRSLHGYIQIGVEFYGGGLWHTWFDRDLTLAGCVILENEQGGFDRRLVHIKRPLLRVPSLCIHLQSAEERKAFAVNKETHLNPVLGLVESNLNSEDGTDARHSPVLLNLLAQELGCEPSAIREQGE